MRATSLCAISLCAIALAAGAITVGGSAEAAPRPAPSALAIIAQAGTGGRPVIAGVTVLRCGPAGGNHANADDACATLAGVRGDLDALPAAPIACPLIYQPVLVKVIGRWQGRIVRFAGQYPNLCVAEADSGGVFRFR
jgi:hypothetical protein